MVEAQTANIPGAAPKTSPARDPVSGLKAGTKSVVPETAPKKYMSLDAAGKPSGTILDAAPTDGTPFISVTGEAGDPDSVSTLTGAPLGEQMNPELVHAPVGVAPPDPPIARKAEAKDPAKK